MRWTSGLFWPTPSTLPVPSDLAERIRIGEDVAQPDGRSVELLAITQVGEKYSIDRAIDAEHVYRAWDARHSDVAKLLPQSEVNLAGRVLALSEG